MMGPWVRRWRTVQCRWALSACLLVTGLSGCADLQGPPARVALHSWTSPVDRVHALAIWPAPPPMEDHTPSLPEQIERVYVIPGSGCAGLARWLPDFFKGLRAQQVVVLHKPHVRAEDWPAPKPCPPAFVAQDDLRPWSQAWRAFLAQDLQQRPVQAHRVVIIGISEGAELLPAVLPQGFSPGLLVLLGSSGLDPWHALQLQSERQADTAFIGELDALLEAREPDEEKDRAERFGGRSLAYWRTLRHWPVARPLQDSHVRVLVLMGTEDERQPPQALQLFRDKHLRTGLCTRLVEGADHGLRIGKQRWSGLWPLVHGLISAPDDHTYAERCGQ